MAIKVGKKAEEGVFQLYSGIGAFNILAVNPNKDILSKITGNEIEEEPEYKGVDKNGKPYVRVVFYAKTDPKAKVNNGIETIIPLSFMLQPEVRVGSQSGKIQIIDKYGRTAWGTKEDLEAKAIPVYSNGKKANISADYRPAYIGEEELINFMIAWFNIPNPMNYNKDTKEWYDKTDMSDSEISLDMKSLLNGNVKEIADIIPSVAPYAVKVCLGVRTTEEGKQYQAFYNRMFLRNSESNYSRVDASIQSDKSRGSLSTSEFSVTPLHEYTVESTDFNKENDPVAEAAANNNPWDNWGK